MSNRLPRLKPKDVLSALKKAGFYVHHQTGSHITLRHRDDPTKRITVPYHKRDLKAGTLRAIIRQTGLSVEEFRRLL